MIKKIKNLKIKIATIFFTSVLTFVQTNAMEYKKTLSSPTNNTIAKENKIVKPSIEKIQITKEMVESFKNFIEKLKNHIDNEINIYIYKTITPQITQSTMTWILILKTCLIQ